MADTTATVAAPAPMGAPPPPSLLGGFLPMVLILGVFYVLVIRPQQKKMREHQAMLTNLRRGDRVVSAGGIMGTIDKVDDDEVLVEIADGVKVRMVKNTLSQVVAKPSPLQDDKPPKKAS